MKNTYANPEKYAKAQKELIREGIFKKIPILKKENIIPPGDRAVKNGSANAFFKRYGNKK